MYKKAEKKYIMKVVPSLNMTWFTTIRCNGARSYRCNKKYKIHESCWIGYNSEGWFRPITLPISLWTLEIHSFWGCIRYCFIFILKRFYKMHIRQDVAMTEIQYSTILYCKSIDIKQRGKMMTHKGSSPEGEQRPLWGSKKQSKRVRRGHSMQSLQTFG